MMFLTIHELSVEFDTPARVLRYRFLQLVQSGKLVEGQDYRRDDFVDDQHFVWRINPVSFTRETGYQVVNKPTQVAAKSSNQENSSVAKQGNEVEKLATKPVNQGGNFDNEKVVLDNSRGSQVGNKNMADTKMPAPMATSPLEREIIDLLKNQIVVKDGQIRDLTDQTLKLNDLNVKLVGQTLKQADHIQTLLRLTGGKSDLSDMVVKEGEATAADGGKMDAKDTGSGYQTVNDTDNHGTNSNAKTSNPPPGSTHQGRPFAA